MGPIARILLRYATGPLLMIGLILPEEQQSLIADPQIVQWVSTALGVVIPMGVEGCYWLAKRLGWKL